MSRGRGLLVLLGVMTSVGAFSIDMYLPALPHIADELHAGAARAQLTLTACLAGLGLGQLLLGPLSDRWGRRRPALGGLGAYAAASLLCAAAPTAEALTAARLVQGLAAGSAIVIARAVVRDRYSGAAAAVAYSHLMLFFGIAPVLAPSVGGLVLGVTTWRGIFVTLAAVGALVGVATVVGLPETLPPERRHGGRLTDTLRGMRALLADRHYVGYVAVLGCIVAGLFGYISGSSFVLQRVYGAAPQLYALLFGLNSLGFVVAGQVNARLVRRVHPRRVLVVALAVMAAGGGGLLVAAHWHSLVAAAAPMFVFMSALGMALPNTTALAMDLHPERAGAASALMGAGQSMFGAAVAPLVGLAGDRSAVPMAVAMTCAATGALLVLATAARATRPAALVTG